MAYNVAWMKVDPLWVAVIRAGLMPFATRIFERILQLSTKAAGQEHAAIHAIDASDAIEESQPAGLIQVKPRAPAGPDAGLAFLPSPAESGRRRQRNSPEAASRAGCLEWAHKSMPAE